MSDQREDWIQRAFYDQPVEAYDTLTFGELEVGDQFISLPLPGDNNGHGGFAKPHYVFRKVDCRDRISNTELVDNSRREKGGSKSHCPLTMSVIKLE
tara:strand:+ start:1079 stop:1369 length:291 start_codon:yes stop_codon:yes gene_type:complete